LFNVVAVFVFHLSVASTVGKGIIDQGIVDHYVVLGALVGAISWNIITWYYAIPSSSSHALIGGLVGAGVAKAGSWALIPAGILKTVAFIFISPLLGFLLGSLLFLTISWLFAKSTPSRVDRIFRRLQLFSSSLYSLGHGGNDAQKTIGIIWMLLIAAGVTGKDESVPSWVIIACYVAIGMGTMFGGWRIVKTMGQRITKIRPVGGFCAVLAAVADASDLHLHFQSAGVLKAQGERDPVPLLERLLDVDEHEMRAAGLQLEAALRRDVVALHLAHAHHVALLEVDVRFHLG